MVYSHSQLFSVYGTVAVRTNQDRVFMMVSAQSTRFVSANSFDRRPSIWIVLIMICCQQQKLVCALSRDSLSRILRLLQLQSVVEKKSLDNSYIASHTLLAEGFFLSYRLYFLVFSGLSLLLLFSFPGRKKTVEVKTAMKRLENRSGKIRKRLC